MAGTYGKVAATYVLVLVSCLFSYATNHFVWS